MSNLPAADDFGALAQALIHSRQTVLPKRLFAPGPDADQRRQLLLAAAAAPDHGQIRPWRFVVVPEACRASAAEREASREKAFRAPLVMLAVARLGVQRADARETPVPPAERYVSLGCALQNMLLAAHAMGYAAALTSGQAMTSTALRALFALAPDEEAVCFLNVGTADRRKPMRQRPDPSEFVTEL
jgi:nitroreductase